MVTVNRIASFAIDTLRSPKDRETVQHWIARLDGWPDDLELNARTVWIGGDEGLYMIRANDDLRVLFRVLDESTRPPEIEVVEVFRQSQVDNLFGTKPVEAGR